MSDFQFAHHDISIRFDTYPRQSRARLTFVHDVVVPVEVLATVGLVAFCAVDWPENTLVAEVAHEELEADECKDAQAEHGQDHHIRKLLHGLDQGAHDGLQA